MCADRQSSCCTGGVRCASAARRHYDMEGHRCGRDTIEETLELHEVLFARLKNGVGDRRSLLAKTGINGNLEVRGLIWVRLNVSRWVSDNLNAPRSKHVRSLDYRSCFLRFCGIHYLTLLSDPWVVY